MAGPVLEGEAGAAVEHRGSHLQIIASAGSGKTEVVSQRVASLLAEGVEPAGIVAFTFTERAASELKERIGLRVEERLGVGALDRLAGLFVGTIHAYCFRFLQQRVPRFETYDVLDDHQLTGFLSRGAKQLAVRQLDPQAKDRLFASIAAFLSGVDVIENELLDPKSMPEPFRGVLLAYFGALERYRLLTYGQQVVRTVEQLERPEVAMAVHTELRHLIVDEYQNVNPAQERLIRLLTGPATHLCVVGDDDQAIYQWRGSDVGNIVSFTDRYPDVATFEITTNRRSRPSIVKGRQPVRRHHRRPPRQADDRAPCADPARRTGSRSVVRRRRGGGGRLDHLLRGRPPRRRPALSRHRRSRQGPRLVPEGGGRARHLRRPGPARRSYGAPTANKVAHRLLKDAARRLVVEYTTTHVDDLHRVWETERPFELHLDGVTVAGRADVILDHEGGVPTSLAILDYKTSTVDLGEHPLQLQVYADAGRREGLDVRGAYVHDLKAGARSPVDVRPVAVAEAEVVVRGAAERLRRRDYRPNPGRACARCEVRTICKAAKL